MNEIFKEIMNANNPAKMWKIMILSPLGMASMFFFALGIVGIFIYGILLAYRPGLVFQWETWVYPLLFLISAIILMNLSLMEVKAKARKFVRSIREMELELGRGLTVDDEKIYESSEFGISSVDIEILSMVKDSGGFVPLLKNYLDESPYSENQTLISLAKLSIMGHIRLPENGMQITITPTGLDLLQMPPVSFSTLVPWDVSLMLIKARVLYRDGHFVETMIAVYNLLERALKAHLIPAIDQHEEKWNEKVRKKAAGDEKAMKLYAWKGEKTIASLNELWNFYKKEANLPRKWKDFTDRTVKLAEKNRELAEELTRILDRSVDVIADTRSKYAHNKDGKRYKKDAYRILLLAEIVIGLWFESQEL